MSRASELIDLLREAGLSLAVAESLTGGALSDAIVSVPGASMVFRGGVVSYATDAKATVLGVDAAVLAEAGPVDPRVAVQMAEGVRRVFRTPGGPAGVGLATTGVAGPGPSDGHRQGTVFVGLSAGSWSRALPLQLDGDRPAVRAATVDLALNWAVEVLSQRGQTVLVDTSVQPRE
ncbi:CinA family protein [Mycetocola reblochoni]|uniref:CinA family protein n=1 Tax=Mycetocola reblochoni TaxID=331618 RepID=UPI003F9661E6